MRFFIVLQVNPLKKINKIIILIFCLFQAVSSGQQPDSPEMPYNYINSTPQNAEVYFNNEYIGNTPLFFTWKDSVFPGQIRVSLKGYSDHSETIYSPELINKNYSLVWLKGSRKTGIVTEDKKPYFEKPRKLFPIVLSSLTAVGAGISAFHFKSLALENRDVYDATGDLAALDRKKKYDIISGVSLALFQVGLGALIYFLLLE
jgi:hypothetical protein